jgi:hypothetical protein
MKTHKVTFLGWVRDFLQGFVFCVVIAAAFFLGVLGHEHGQAIIDALPSIESSEPPPITAGAPKTSLTAKPSKGVL